jgi:hypothetical protein
MKWLNSIGKGEVVLVPLHHYMYRERVKVKLTALFTLALEGGK